MLSLDILIKGRHCVSLQSDQALCETGSHREPRLLLLSGFLEEFTLAMASGSLQHKDQRTLPDSNVGLSSFLKGLLHHVDTGFVCLYLLCYLCGIVEPAECDFVHFCYCTLIHYLKHCIKN
uniref:Uncharacterized protein n=1 Tax=Sphaerodactylus townsendi TaxID=933632 RepID=A0ACB8FCH3_9SAUR